MKLALSQGSTSVIFHIFVSDATVTTGAGKTGLTYSSFTVGNIRAGSTWQNMATQDISTLGTYAAPTSGSQIRIKEMSATDAPGLYEVQVHNTNLAAGANQVVYMFRATDAAPTLVEVQLAPCPANLTQILATALTETVAGYLTAAFKKLFDVATPVLTAACVNQTGDVYAVGVRSTTPANTLDVSATGEVGLDFSNIKQATAATTLTNITVPTVTGVTGSAMVI